MPPGAPTCMASRLCATAWLFNCCLQESWCPLVSLRYRPLSGRPLSMLAADPPISIACAQEWQQLPAQAPPILIHRESTAERADSLETVPSSELPMKHISYRPEFEWDDQGSHKGPDLVRCGLSWLGI